MWKRLARRGGSCTPQRWWQRRLCSRADPSYPSHPPINQSITRCAVHYINNAHFAQVTYLEREIELSPWGNAYFEERYNLVRPWGCTAGGADRYSPSRGGRRAAGARGVTGGGAGKAAAWQGAPAADATACSASAARRCASCDSLWRRLMRAARCPLPAPGTPPAAPRGRQGGGRVVPF